MEDNELPKTTLREIPEKTQQYPFYGCSKESHDMSMNYTGKETEFNLIVSF